MSRRRFILTLACVAAGRLAAADAASEESFWSALKSGGYVVLLRHAVTELGIGDPPNFKLEDCGTQRNLSAKGRADAERIGKAFRARGIPIEDVLSSRWCRCIDTAQLAFERVKPEPMLDSMFNAPESVRKKRRAPCSHRLPAAPAPAT
jgi:Histidine phosphatase superfamily (branch 1)